MILPASYSNGFAPRDGMPLYPSLWRGCAFAAAPCLGPTGLTLRDWSGFGRHGTLTNMDPGTDWVVSRGKYNLDFDATNDYVVTGSTVSLATVHSVSAWFRCGTMPSFFDYNAAFGEAGSTNTNPVGFTSTKVVYTVGASAIGPTRTYANGEVLHVAVNRVDTAIEFFVNGRSIGTGTLPDNTSFTLNRIGARQLVAGLYFSGGIFESLFYTRTLSPNEIMLLSQGPGVAFSLASRRRSSSAVAAFNRRRRLLLGST